uniref:Uncharacterized protein n=1 Tax=viral metagenome TaxID=1070528 RepID=A0A6C0C7E4_9ZZZZ
MYLFDYLTNNYLFMSGAFLLNMFGGRMLFQDIQPHLHNKFYLKYLFIFCLFFIATKDINLSLILIVIYIIFIQFINEFKKEEDEKNNNNSNQDKVNNAIDLLNDVKSRL